MKTRHSVAVHKHTDNRPRRGADSVVIQITTTTALVAVLDEIVKTGFFGTSRAAAAERILAEGVRGLLKEGTIQKRQKAVEEK